MNINKSTSYNALPDSSSSSTGPTANFSNDPPAQKITAFVETLPTLGSSPEITRQKLTEIQCALNTWIKAGPPNERLTRTSATQRILKAFQNQSKELDLGRLNLISLPACIGELKQLTTLDLSFNQLTSLPDAICGLSNLQKLVLSFNPLTSLPTAIHRLGNLQQLQLINNGLTALPDAICRLGNLRKLDLAYNYLTSLPDAICRLGNLRQLRLANNQFTALPDAICGLGNLQILELTSNQLTALSDAICKLGNLQQLDLSGNQLTALSDAICKLGNLQMLHLMHNKLTSLPNATIRLGSLRSLALDYNQLTEIMPLASLPLETIVTITNNPLSPAAIQAFREAITHQWSAGPNSTITLFNNQPPIRQITSLKEEIQGWQHAFYQAFPNSTQQPRNVDEFYHSLLNHPCRDSLFQFLQRIRIDSSAHPTSTQDFLRNRKGVIERVNKILTSACEHPIFLQKLFCLLKDASTSRGYRVAYYLNKIDLYQSLLCNPSQTTKELAERLLNPAQADILEQIAQTHKSDEIEVLLRLDEILATLLVVFAVTAE